MITATEPSKVKSACAATQVTTRDEKLVAKERISVSSFTLSLTLILPELVRFEEEEE
jgi:hypothetical protein